MNIIIDSKYASVYAAVRSSAWEAVSRKGPASDISYKAYKFLSLQVVTSVVSYSCRLSVGQDYHTVQYGRFMIMVSELCL